MDAVQTGPAIGSVWTFRYDAVRIPEDRPHVPHRYPPDRSHRGAELPAGTLVGRKWSIFLVLHHRYHQYRRGDGATADPALDHYRRLGPQAGSPRRRRGRQTARARAGRALRIYQRRAAADCVGFHDRPLPDGERERRAVRDRRADVLARQPRQQAGVELGVVHCAASPEASYPPTGRPNGRPMTGSGGYPVRRSLSISSLMSRNTGSPAFAGDDGRGIWRGDRMITSLRAKRSNPFFLYAARWIASLRSQ